MRGVAVLFILLTASTVAADKKLQELLPNYQREHGACTTQAGGMQKVATGVAALAKQASEADRPELEKAAAALAKGSMAFTEYCGELGGLIGYLQANADAVYKSVEREIDTRASKVSKLRREAKRLTEELGPLTRKMIPRITKLPTAAPEPEKRAQVKFPSGRAVALPVLAGSWKTSGTATSDVAEYEDKLTIATVTTRQLAGDCVDHRTFVKEAEEFTELDVKTANVAWAVRYVRKEKSGSHLMMMACMPRRPQAAGEPPPTMASLLAVVDLTPDTSPLADKLLTVGLAMLAAHELKP
jgi:hypothetical protein